MSEQKHTPGPWVAICRTLEEAQDDGEFCWVSSGGVGPIGWTPEFRVGSVWLSIGGGTTGLPGSIETSEANALLIAAAPEMRDALEFIRDNSGDPVMKAVAICAIAKSIGAGK